MPDVDGHGSSPLELLQELENSSLGNLLSGSESVETDSWQGFVFNVDGIQFAVPFAGAFEIIPCGELAPIPMAKSWVRGIANVRGEIYTVVDFPEFIGKPPIHNVRGSNILLLPDEKLRSALLVEGRVALNSFSEDMTESDDRDYPENIKPYLSRIIGDGERNWGVLDMDALSHAEEFLNISE